MLTHWHPALPIDSLRPGHGKLVRAGSDQIAVFLLEDGAVYAVDNRCPHEGYPLIQGTLKDCVLTCSWHNFKFDLRDGACLMGDEAVRSYPVRVVDGQVELDLSPPDPTAARARLWTSLNAGMQEYGMGRVARDVARLLQTGVPAAEIAAWSARYDAVYAEYGTTHAMPVAADVLAVLPRYPGARAVLPLTQALEVGAFSHIRMPARTQAAAEDPGDPATFPDRLRELVETEQAGPAEGLLRGAIAAGWGRERLEDCFFQLCADHFLDFGHALIYSTKVWDLLDVKPDFADPILPALLHGIVTGTREDVLPAWAAWRKRLAELAPELPALTALQPESSPAADNAALAPLVHAILDGGPAGSFQAITDALRAGLGLDAIATALVLAASERILRFDSAIDARADVQNGWLDVTHLLTFASAVRVATRRFRSPEALRLLFASARFINKAHVLDLPKESWLSLDAAQSGTVESTLAAIAARRPQDAVALAAAAIRDGLAQPLTEALADLAFADIATRGIVVAHILKTSLAAGSEVAITGSPLPLLAATRLLASPIAERRVRRQVGDAVGLVYEGRTPQDLVG